MTDADLAAEQEFNRIMHTYLNPQAAVRVAMDTVQGRGLDYWETRTGDDAPPAPWGR